MQKLIGIIILAMIGVWLLKTVVPKTDQDSTESTIESSVEQPATPFTAQFLIYTNGTQRIFTATMYHRQSPAAYLTSENPSIIHVEQPNITWQVFFDTLPFSLDPTCLTTGTGQRFCSDESQRLSFFLNGAADPQALAKTIQPNDQLLITFGPNNDQHIEQQLQSF